MKANISLKIVDILEKELSYADFAAKMLNNEIKIFEREYSMSSKSFLKRFEKGELGDDRKWFGWYCLLLSMNDWDDTKTEITKTLRAN
ncbi:hypothetical protein KJ980_02145 [Patescibacteria group bacterium]|nr:hypothetical protein [Patescibacteria group bacterium]